MSIVFLEIQYIHGRVALAVLQEISENEGAIVLALECLLAHEFLRLFMRS